MPSRTQMLPKDTKLSVSMVKSSKTIRDISSKWKPIPSLNRPRSSQNDPKTLEHTVAHSLMNTNPHAHFSMRPNQIMVEKEQTTNRVLADLTQTERLRSVFGNKLSFGPFQSMDLNRSGSKENNAFGRLSFDSLSWGEDEVACSTYFDICTIDKHGFPVISRTGM